MNAVLNWYFDSMLTASSVLQLLTVEGNIFSEDKKELHDVSED